MSTSTTSTTSTNSSSSSSRIATVDPASGAVLAEYEAFDDARIEAAVAAAHTAAGSWAATPLPQRLELLAALAATLRAGRDEYAALITAEMGKPVTEAAGEITKSATTADYYVANAPGCWPTSTSTSTTSTGCRRGSGTSRSGSSMR